jgi:hypothetical protein
MSKKAATRSETAAAASAYIGPLLPLKVARLLHIRKEILRQVQMTNHTTLLEIPAAPGSKSRMRIPPFLVGLADRTHAASRSSWAGVTPPMPMFGRW